MQALPSDRHRAFVRALYTVRPGHGAAVKAAKIAGFGTAESSASSMATIASRLKHDERILEAIEEEDKKYIRASAPRAISALSRLIEDPKHKDHARGIGMVLERVHPVEQVHNVKHSHDVTPAFQNTAQIMARMAELAAKYCALPPSIPAPVVIENDEAPPCR
jgi:phage terminase small subunit